MSLLSHSRFFLTLRSKEGKYHSLILFRLTPTSEETNEHRAQPATNPIHDQIYVMESSCPHLGADLSHAEIEECEMTMVAVCPWHRRVQSRTNIVVFIYINLGTTLTSVRARARQGLEHVLIPWR